MYFLLLIREIASWVPGDAQSHGGCIWAQHTPRSFLCSLLIGLAPLCENMPSGKANKPGDVVRAKNGKTIQVRRWNTASLAGWSWGIPRSWVNTPCMGAALGLRVGKGAFITGSFLCSQKDLWEL